jgi:DNA-binding response OmpR family regulator
MIEVWYTDILILDLNLPEEDGISITRCIRRSLPAVGIILLTANKGQHQPAHNQMQVA